MPSAGIIDAAGQRLIDLGLAGVVILGLVAGLVFLWKARERDRDKIDAQRDRVEEQLEKRVVEQAAARDAITKAISTLDVVIHERQRSHQE